MKVRVIGSIAVFVLASTLAAAPAPAAEGAPGPRAQTGVHTVPSRMCGPFFLVPLRLPETKAGEARELIFLFDSGASVSFIDPGAVLRVAGREVRPGTRVTLRDARAGPLTFGRLTAAARDLGHLTLALGEPFDGILGFSAFRDFLLTLDYPGARMTVSRGTLPPPDGGEVFDARGPDTRPYVDARAGGRTHRMLIDTGYSSTFALRPREDMLWRTSPAPVTTTVQLGGPGLREAGRLREELRLGAHRFTDPLVSLTAQTELMGAQALKHFRVTFDQRSKRVRLSRAQAKPIEMPPFAGTGAILRPRPEGLQVTTVLKGSPAEASGLRAGDLIVTADGNEALRRGCPQDTREGTVVTYEVRRGRDLVKIMIRRDVLVE